MRECDPKSRERERLRESAAPAGEYRVRAVRGRAEAISIVRESLSAERDREACRDTMQVYTTGGVAKS